MKRIFPTFLLALLVALPAFAQPETAAERTAKVHYNLGTELYSKGDFEKAEHELSLAIQLAPNAPDAYYNRGWTYRRRLYNQAAIADFTRAIELFPNHISYYLSRANTRVVEGDFEGGIADATQAIAMDPEESHGYFIRGIAYLLKNEAQKAFEDAAKTLTLDPNLPHARRLLYDALVKREEALTGKPVFPQTGGKTTAGWSSSINEPSGGASLVSTA